MFHTHAPGNTCTGHRRPGGPGPSRRMPRQRLRWPSGGHLPAASPRPHGCEARRCLAHQGPLSSPRWPASLPPGGRGTSTPLRLGLDALFLLEEAFPSSLRLVPASPASPDGTSWDSAATWSQTPGDNHPCIPSRSLPASTKHPRQREDDSLSLFLYPLSLTPPPQPY